MAAAAFTAGCSKTVNRKISENKYDNPRDVHSFSNPDQVRVRHVALDLAISFPGRTLQGNVILTVERAAGAAPEAPLILDSRDLKVAAVEASADGLNFSPAQWQSGERDQILGTPLTIRLMPAATHVRIQYETSPQASALQWLTPDQTADRQAAFLYTQGQAIHTRSWIPLQDSPGVRVTYSARIRTPKDLLAVMSARNERATHASGVYQFDMPQSIPPYLIALAVGKLEYRAVSHRAGVYGEPSIAVKAAREFEDLESILQAAESLYGAYRWEQYDVLVLPPSFPYGGMENPRLTFVSPTLLAGDKSLVSVVTHEIAHSWSGNLVTNATWRDFWLNEGFTTYLERRIQERVYGPERSAMEAVIEYEQMLQELPRTPEADQPLYANWQGRDPDTIPAPVAYTKGSLLLRNLEEVYERERFDTFLRSYFGRFAFQSITTGQFVDFLRASLLNQNPSLEPKVNLEAWLSRPGVPPSAPVPKSEALDNAAAAAREWSAGKRTTASLPAGKWSTQEWLRFLLALPGVVSEGKMAEADQAFGMSDKGNAEVLFQWLLVSVRSRYEPAYPALEKFLTRVGRRKFVKPLYEELAKTAEGKQRALAIYAKAKSGYHPVTQAAVNSVLEKNRH
jgi:aminopeptidase N